jgi:4-hydroxy-tetrahydrodipicolinate synthase
MKNLNQTTLWTAIVTPLLDNGEIDYKSFEELLKKQEEAGNGVVVLGSTGEALNLSQAEKEEVVKFTAQKRLSTPVFCGVGGFNIDETKNWIKFIEEHNLDGHLLVTPLYSKPGDEGQKLWFEELLNTATKPCMLYNVPSRAGKELSLKAVKSLNKHKNFWAIKEASGDVEKFSEYVQAAENQVVYSGDDALLPYFAAVGAAGVVSVASNCWPKETKAYVETCLNGTYRTEAYPLWEKACQALFTASNPIPAKALLQAKGWIKSANLRLPLSLRDFYELKSLVEIDHEVNNWYIKYSQKG